jgi:hypothetical protein
MIPFPRSWAATASDAPKAEGSEGWVIGGGHTVITGESGPLVSFVTTAGPGHRLSPPIAVSWSRGGPAIEHPMRAGLLLLVRAEKEDLFDLCHARRDHVLCLSCLVFIGGTILLDARGSFSSNGDYVIESEDPYTGQNDRPAFRSVGTMSWRMHVSIQSVDERLSPSRRVRRRSERRPTATQPMS